MMAEDQVRSVLEREVTCPLCLSLFKEPKKLPCDHVYCKECLGGLALRSLNATITCPECRAPTQIPNNDVSNFPTAFHMNRIMEAFKKVEQTSKDERDSPSTTGNCQDHPIQPLVIYCKTCMKQLCRDCVLRTQDHASHKYGFFKEVADEYRKKVNSEFESVECYKTSLSIALEDVRAAQKDTAGHEKNSKKEIDSTFEELLSVLQTWKEEMIKESELHYQSIAGISKSQEDQIKEALSELNTLSATVDSCIHNDNTSTITNTDSTLTAINSVHRKLRTTPVSVTKSQPLALQCITSEEFQHYLRSECSLHKPASSEMCTIEDLSVLDLVEKDHQTTVILHLFDSTGKRCMGQTNHVDVELCALQDESKIKSEVKALTPGKVQITFMPQKRGKYRLLVKVNGSHIRHSPFTIIVSKALKQMSEPVAVITTVEQPRSVTCSQGKLIVASGKTQSIVEIDSQFQEQELTKFKGVNELVVHKNFSLYVTTKDNFLHKTTPEGTCSIGGLGKGDTKFDLPNGLRINQYDELYVCDSNNHRIQIFDLDLNFKRTFGREGCGISQLSAPTDVDFDIKGNVYIVDSWNNRIQVFTHDDQHIQVIRNQTLGNSKLNTPLSICIHNNFIYVTDYYNHRVVVMNQKGELATILGAGRLKKPGSIAINQHGFVYVISNYSQIFVF